MNALYTADVKIVGGREGSIESSDGVLKHSLSMPKELGGSGGAGTNPELAEGAADRKESDLHVHHS